MRHAHHRGYTLAEMVIVVLIIAILAAIAVPMLAETLDEARLDAAARRLVSDIHYAQALSLQKGNLHGLVFNADSESYELHELPAGESGTVIITNPLTKQPFARSMASLDEGIDIVRTTFFGIHVFFDAFGAPIFPGTIELRRGDQMRIITVDAASGRVTVAAMGVSGSSN